MRTYTHTLDNDRVEHRDFLAQTPREAITHEPITEGDTIVICATKNCQAKYYSHTWIEIGGKCSICGSNQTLNEISPRPIRNIRITKPVPTNQSTPSSSPPDQPVATPLSTNSSAMTPSSFKKISWIVVIIIAIFIGIKTFSTDKESTNTRKERHYQQNFTEKKPNYDEGKNYRGSEQKPKGGASANMYSKQKTEVESVVRNYSMKVKVKAHSTLDSRVWRSILVDPILEMRLRGTCWLKKKGFRYVFSDQNFTVKETVFYNNYSRASVLAKISEKRSMINSAGATIRPFQYSEYRAIYHLKRIDQKWYISCVQALKREMPDTMDCRVELNKAIPCGQ